VEGVNAAGQQTRFARLSSRDTPECRECGYRLRGDIRIRPRKDVGAQSLDWPRLSHREIDEMRHRRICGERVVQGVREILSVRNTTRRQQRRDGLRTLCFGLSRIEAIEVKRCQHGGVCRRAWRRALTEKEISADDIEIMWQLAGELRTKHGGLLG